MHIFQLCWCLTVRLAPAIMIISGIAPEQCCWWKKKPCIALFWVKLLCINWWTEAIEQFCDPWLQAITKPNQTKPCCADAAISCGLAAERKLVYLKSMWDWSPIWEKQNIITCTWSFQIPITSPSPHLRRQRLQGSDCSTKLGNLRIPWDWFIVWACIRFLPPPYCIPLPSKLLTDPCTHLVHWDQRHRMRIEACFRMNGEGAEEVEVRILEKRAQIQDVYEQVRPSYPSLPPLRDFQVTSIPARHIPHNMVNFRRTL